ADDEGSIPFTRSNRCRSVPDSWRAESGRSSENERQQPDHHQKADKEDDAYGAADELQHLAASGIPSISRQFIFTTLLLFC
ncbi:MAG TPA: hypothetical protein VKY54_02465, partial [Kiloniellales bacterium]|nr:hypothetical protein [Kiloniellales bacterium]